MFVKKYQNGLTVIIEENKMLRSVAAGIMVGTGSVFETPQNNGISHFIEHMQFKGTGSRSAKDIVEQFDSAGATYNAFTGKEYTCFYFKSIDERVETCFDILADLFCNSTFLREELDRERKVIIEEINMSKDEPDGVCYDVLYKTAFAPGSLGMEILGTKQNVSAFGKEDILAYKAQNYLPENTVVAFVGNISAERGVELAERYLDQIVGAPAKTRADISAQTFCPGYGSYIHSFEQSEVSVGYPALVLGDERATALSAMDAILGGGMSSRLFQRLREQLGLVYSVYSTPWFGRKNGMMTVCANVNPANAEIAAVAIREEIEKLVSAGVTDAEVEKAKTQLKTAAIFGSENPMNQMLAYMRKRVLLGEDYDLNDLLRRIDAVTAPDINALARDIFLQSPAVAYVGKKPAADVGKIFLG